MAKTQNRQVRNGKVELARFVASVIIVLVHSSLLSGKTTYPFSKGGVCTDFFSMMTGYYTYIHIEKHNNEITPKYVSGYVVSKFKEFFLYSAAGILLCYIWRFRFLSMSVVEKVSILLNFPFELFCMNISGISTVYMDSPLWYVSAMLLSLPMFFILVKWAGDWFRYYLCAAIPFIIYGYYNINFGGIGMWGNTPLFLSGCIRVFGGFCLGGTVRIVAEESRFSKIIIKTPLLFELLFSLPSVLLMHFYTEMHSDFVIILLMAFLLFSLTSDTKLSRMNGVFLFLGKLSVPLYCIHWPVYLFTESFVPFASYYCKLGLSLGIDFALCLFLLFIKNTISDVCECHNIAE